MLASIHPLGERGRGQRWGITAMAYMLGSTAGGAVLGAVAGAVGSLAPSGWSVATLLGAVVCGAAAVADARRPQRPVPTIARQVNEQWLTSFRGWVYGLGFGLQLGLGVVTIVTTALVYAAVALAAISASPAAGAIIGAAFGLARALPLLAVRRVDDPTALRELHRRFQAFEPFGRRLTLAGSLTVTLALALSSVWM